MIFTDLPNFLSETEFLNSIFKVICRIVSNNLKRSTIDFVTAAVSIVKSFQHCLFHFSSRSMPAKSALVSISLPDSILFCENILLYSGGIYFQMRFDLLCQDLFSIFVHDDTLPKTQDFVLQQSNKIIKTTTKSKFGLAVAFSQDSKIQAPTCKLLIQQERTCFQSKWIAYAAISLNWYL